MIRKCFSRIIGKKMIIGQIRITKDGRVSRDKDNDIRVAWKQYGGGRAVRV